MASFYNITRARGGKHDIAIKRGLEFKINELQAGSIIKIKLDSWARWAGRDRVDIHSNGVNFIDKNDHTFSPVAIKAAVRILHKFGFRGRFEVEVFGDKVTIQPLQITNRDNNATERFQTAESNSLDCIDDISLWEQALTNPVPLFKTAKHDPLIALFDDKGFYLSEDAKQVYEQIKSKPHIYVARSESGNYLYFGISNQQGGRWKRAHAYHLGTLAYEILGTTRYDDQNHSHWVEAWFLKNSYKYIQSESKYSIRMKERILISFYTPKIQVTKRDLERAESKLISIAEGKGLDVLNRKKIAEENGKSIRLSHKKNALFIIPCCKKKAKGGNYPSWNDVRYDKKFNRFQFLDEYRIKLINFYRSLSSDEAFLYFKNRGATEDIRRKNVKKAWQTNLEIFESKTLLAINRYQGNLYESINRSLLEQFRQNQITNVIIVSALFGLITPTDLIPDYDLMMSDKSSEGDKVWRFWKNTFVDKNMEQIVNNLFSEFDYIYCLLSSATGYLDSIIELLFNHASYVIKSNKTGSAEISRSWGRVLTDALMSQVYSPGDVERIANENDCNMIDLNFQKKGGIF